MLHTLPPATCYPEHSIHSQILVVKWSTQNRTSGKNTKGSRPHSDLPLTADACPASVQSASLQYSQKTWQQNHLPVCISPGAAVDHGIASRTTAMLLRSTASLGAGAKLLVFTEPCHLSCYLACFASQRSHQLEGCRGACSAMTFEPGRRLRKNAAAARGARIEKRKLKR